MEPEIADRRAKLRGRLPAAALIGVGLAALYAASDLSFGTVRQPGSGFFPTLVCVALIVFGGLALADPARALPAPGSGGEARIWLVVAALAAYGWALAPVGFLPCTMALLLLLLRGIGGVSWPISLAAAAVGAIACYGLFTRLGMPLPAGVLGS
ncbi:MAG: tripartite tricarboxylate transporter TctB family protein [Burkholderiales bacterium]